MMSVCGVTLSLTILLVVLTSPTCPTAPDCSLDDDGSSSSLSTCLTLGHDFLDKYAHFLKRSAKKFRTFDLCG